MGSGLLIGLLALAGAPEGASERGEAALRALEKTYGDRAALTARYVQKRSSALMKAPLTSEGELAFTRSPPVLRFDTGGTVIRVTEERYEVYRREDGVVEQASLQRGSWTTLLFSAFAQQVDALLERFEVVKSRRDGPRRVVKLRPKRAEDRERLKSLELTVDQEAHRLTELAYTDPGGDRVEIELSNVELHESLPAKATALGAPESARRISLDAPRDADPERPQAPPTEVAE